MDRRRLVAMLGLSLLAPLRSTHAQQPPRVRRIGYLTFGSPGARAPHLEAFRQGLVDLGWVEPRNIVIEVRVGRYEDLPTLAAELVRLKVDLIFAATTPGALAAKGATTSIPIVIGWVADPVGSGLVTSLSHPGSNITGWTHSGMELRPKYLDLLKQAVPAATQLGVLWNPANRVHADSLGILETTAKALRTQLHPVGVRDPQDLESAFSRMSQKGVEGLAVLPDGMFLAQSDVIITLAARNRLPAIYGLVEFAEAGGLMAYGVNLYDMFRRGASYVDRILRGARPADLPVEQPTRIELVINLRAAKTLGLTIPQSVLLRADRIIE
jgi:putative ABC transport system substrate-binding protein